ncbi:hypothetical protein CPter291_3658 [Collimonas pratensis]|uniref:Uncharacterized protein n=2 Tax=Collimonas pratensis TaxID=279113 RepID=A0ABN4MJU3_9BURK|nr:hypothetical protein CPter291_3658 [Collimonas pratensis]
MPPDTAPLYDHDKTREEKECDIENALDEALEESFPASDPIAIAIEKPPCPPI